MVVWLFRLLLLLAVIVILYSGWKYVTAPQRKLEAAQRRKQLYLWDDPKDARKNLFIVCKGVQFEGEKYIGATENEFVVTSILMRMVEPDQLFGLNREDFYRMEQEIYAAYPLAEITWQNPVGDFLKHKH
ncbi:MAG TPA: sigma-w pathway protein ysdB [Bacillales bacterium]